MNSLVINSIELVNIRCFEKFFLQFSTGSNVITGENGAGKSTILTSIGYGLFGNQYLTKMSLKTTDLIKWGEEEGTINLVFTIQSQTYESRHRINLKNKNKWVIKKYKEQTILSNTLSESKELILKLFNYKVDHIVYKNALCSPQGQLTSLLDESPQIRKDQIRKILGLHDYTIATSHMRKFNTQLENNIQTHSNIINSIEQFIDDPKAIEIEILNQKNYLAQRIQELTKISNNLKNLEQEILDQTILDQEINNLGKLIRQAKANIENLSTENDKRDVAINDWFTTINMNRLNYDDLANKYSNNKTIEDQLQNQKNQLETSIQSFNEKLIEKDRKLKEIESIEAILTDLQLKHNETTKELDLNGLKTELNKIKTKEELFLTEKEKIQNDIKNQGSALEKIKEKILTHSNRILEIKNSYQLEFSSDISTLADVTVITQNEIDQCSTEINTQTNRQKELSAQMGELQSIINSIDSMLEILSNVHQHSYCPMCEQNLLDTDQTKLITKHNQQRLVLNDKISKLKTELTSSENKLLNLNSKANSINSKFGLLKEFSQKIKSIEEWQLNINELINEEKLKSTEIQQLQNQLNLFSSDEYKLLQNKGETLANKINMIEKYDKELLTNKTKLITFNQQFQELDNLLKQIDLDKITHELKLISTNYTLLKKQNTIIAKELLPLLTLQVKGVKDLQELQNGTKNKELHFQSIQSKFKHDYFKKISEEEKEVRTRLGSIKQEIKSLQETQLPELEKKLIAANQHAKLLEDSQEKLNNLNKIRPRVLLLENTFSSLPEILISRISDKVSRQISNTMQRILPNRGFKNVIFNADGEIEISNVNNTIIDKNMLSGGEKTVLGVALRLALADQVAPLQFLILDEPTNHLDIIRINEFVDIIDNDTLFTNNAGQLILVTHRDEFDKNATKSIRIDIQPSGERKLKIDDDINNLINY
ncbi:MAG: SMC family ATPase [Candidatus Heimdallarchaeota archaeon]|nr:SMC family ATPase [Candidatus Heimdallarchaeota archaeon]MDH5644545.1 SMC family ATPase [Candidatus Heimdallarchaeota archaeon]